MLPSSSFPPPLDTDGKRHKRLILKRHLFSTFARIQRGHSSLSPLPSPPAPPCIVLSSPPFPVKKGPPLKKSLRPNKRVDTSKKEHRQKIEGEYDEKSCQLLCNLLTKPCSLLSNSFFSFSAPPLRKVALPSISSQSALEMMVLLYPPPLPSPFPRRIGVGQCIKPDLLPICNRSCMWDRSKFGEGKAHTILEAPYT